MWSRKAQLIAQTWAARSLGSEEVSLSPAPDPHSEYKLLRQYVALFQGRKFLVKQLRGQKSSRQGLHFHLLTLAFNSG
jgi:hypothetical protein